MADKISTGLCDTNGDLIHVGDRLKMSVTVNNEVHGDWVIYEVRQQGLTPIITYIESEKGKVLQEGYLASPLCDQYNEKLFVFTLDPAKLRPMEDMYIIK